MLEARLDDLERRRHRKDRLAVLDRDDAARREALAVANPIDLVHDRLSRVADAQEVAVHRVGEALAGDGLFRGRQRLADDLAAEHVAPAEVLTLTAEEIVLDAFEAEQIEQLAEDVRHAWRR